MTLLLPPGRQCGRRPPPQLRRLRPGQSPQRQARRLLPCPQRQWHCRRRLAGPPRRWPRSPLDPRQVDLTTEEGRKVKQKLKKKIRRRRTQGEFSGKRVTCAWICSRGINHQRITGAVPCRRTIPCQRVLPCRRALPCRGLLPWRRSRSRWHFGTSFRALLIWLLCSYTNQQARYQQRKKHSCAPDSKKLTMNLRWGLRWGLL